MGSRFGKHLRDALSAALAVCMAVSLCPASALAAGQLTEEEAQAAIGAWEPAADEQGGAVGEDGTTAAQTTVSVSTYSSFRAESYEGPGTADNDVISTEDSKDATADSGRLQAKFVGGRPLDAAATVNGVSIPAGEYAMVLTWKKNGEASSAYSLTLPQKPDAQNQSVCNVAVTLNDIFGDAEREGRYEFFMALQGAAGQKATVTFPAFTISDTQFPVLQINNKDAVGEGVPYTVVDGQFAKSAVLSVTDITAGEGSSAAATLGMLQDQAAGSSIAAAWQVQVTNGTALNPNLVKKADKVTITLSDDAAKALTAAGADAMTLVSLVGGATHGLEFSGRTQGTNEAGQATYTFTATAEGGEQVQAVATVTDAGTTLSFATAGLGGGLGAFALAMPAAGTYKVKPSATNGTISPMGEGGVVERAVGTDAVFELSPLGGYVLDPKPVVRINGTKVAEGSAYSISGNTLTLKARNAGTTTTLAVEFQPYEPEPVNPDNPDGPAITKMNMQVSGAGDQTGISGSTIKASFQQVQVVDGAEVAVPQTVTGATPELTDVQAGTPVQLEWTKLADGRVVKGVRTGATLDEAQNAALQTVTGTMFTIPAMGTNTQFVVVEYEVGVMPPIQSVTHKVKGLAGEGGSVAGGPENGISHGNGFTSAVRADANYTIATVKVYRGLLDAADDAALVADLTSKVAGLNLTAYDVLLSSVTEDLTVAATFQRAPLTVTVAQVAGGSVRLTQAGGNAVADDAQSPYSVPYGADATFAFNVQDGYRFDGILLGTAKKSLSDLGVAEDAERGSFTLGSLQASITLTPVFLPIEMPNPTEYRYATVASDGNGTVSPEGGASFPADGTLKLSFGTVAGKEAWRASKLTVSAGAQIQSADLGQQDWSSYVFDPAVSPWNKLDAGPYTITVAFKDMTNGGTQQPPEDLPEPAHIALGVLGGGQVSPAGTLVDGQHTFTTAPGEPQTFALIPDEGWHLDKVRLSQDGGQMVDVTNASVDGKPYVADGVLTLTPAEGASYKVLVEFKQNAQSEKVRWNVVTRVAAGEGRITPPGTSKTNDGETQEFTFWPGDGQKLKSVTVRTADGDASEVGDFADAEPQVMTNMVTNGTLKLTVNANMLVEAEFEPLAQGEQPEQPKKAFTLKTAVDAAGGGTVSPEAGSSMLVAVDGSLTLSFKPDRGWRLAEVSVECADPQWSVSPKLTDMAEDNGVYGYRFGLPAGSEDRFDGATVTVTAAFERIPVSYTVTVQTQGPGQSDSVATSQSEEYGYVSPGYDCGSKLEVGAGASQTFAFVEKPGFVVDAVYVNGQRKAGSVQGYQLTGVTGDATLLVVYKAQGGAPGTDVEQMHTVTASAGPNGSIAPAGESQVSAGGSILLTLLPDDGYQLDTLTVTPAGGKAAVVYRASDPDTHGNIDGNTYTLEPVEQDYAVSATFATASAEPDDGDDRPKPGETVMRHVFVTVTGDGAGMVTPGGFRKGDVQGDVEVPDGGQASFSFIPDEAADGKANELDYIEVTCAGLTHTLTPDKLQGSYYTLSKLHADARLTVAFKQVDTSEPGYQPPVSYKKHTVTATASKGGKVEPAAKDGKTVVNAGASLTLRMVPDPGFHLSYVSVKAEGDGSTRFLPASELADGCLVLGNIQDSYAVNAVFAADGSAAEDGFTAYTVQADGAQVRASLTGVVNVKQGADQTLVLTPTFGHQVTRVTVRSAAGEQLWQRDYAGDAARRAVEVPLTYRAGCASATVVVESSAVATQPSPEAVYTVTASVAADAAGNKLGTITPSGTQQFKAGSSVTFQLVPFSGCTVDSVTANGAPVVVQPTADGYYQFTSSDLSGALNVVAKFRKVTSADADVPAPGKMASVSFDVQGAGSVQPASPAQVRPGDSLPITLVPKAGAKLGTLTVGGRDVTAQAELLSNGSYAYTLENVQDGLRVSAIFVNDDGTVDDTTNDVNVDVKVEVKVAGNVFGGTVDPSKPITLKPGASQTFLVKPADGYYVADAAIEWADGRIEHPAVKAWDPDYGTGQQGADAGRSIAQTSQVSSLGSLLGVEQAHAAGEVQKPYSYVTVDDIRSSFTMLVTLDDCMKDPANTGKELYLYTDAAAGLLGSNPTVSGNGTVTPSDNTDVVGPSGDKTLIITPGVKDDGETSEDIKNITINGQDIDLTDPSLKKDPSDPNSPQDPAKVIQAIKDSGALKPGEDITWVDTPAPGHYELTLKAEQGEDGKWAIDQPVVEFGGEGAAYTTPVRVRAFELMADGTYAPIDGDVLKVTATRLADGKTVVNDSLDLEWGGAVRVVAELQSDQYELVGIRPDDSGYLSTTQRPDAGTARSRAAEPMALAAEPRAASSAEGTFYAYGPGAILATIQKKASTADPNDPQANVYYVTATAGKGGTISAAKPSYPVGETAQFTLKPADGYQVASVTVNGKKSDWSSTSYTVPRELCTKGAKITVHAEFKALMPGAGDPQATGGKRALRTLQSLASTGDAGAPVVTGLLAVACGALGVAVLMWSRTRRRPETGTTAPAAHAKEN